MENEKERQELNKLINKGIEIEVETTIFKKPKGLLGRFRKLEKHKQMQVFKILEPTLSTLDRMSAEQIELKIDEAVMSSPQGMSAAKVMTKDHSKRMAKILALAVLGQDYIIAEQRGKSIKYNYDNKKLNELTELFFHYLKPSTLLEYALMFTTLSNLADFTNSIRLMSAARTTMPIRVEEKQQD